MAIKDILKTIETPYVDAQTLLGLLSDYQKPRECISRMVKNKELMRLKNGFYLIADKIRQGTNTLIPYEQVANLLYGPSYVSLEWALSFYGMIPERVHTVTNMTLGKNKEYHTPVGDFVYYKLSPNSYSIGVTQKKATDSPGGFLIASPEKALADLVFKTCKGLDKEGVRQELLESRRIDREHFHQLDRGLLGEIAKSYHIKSVNHLADLVGVL
jgi:predicted transcriptional regulator of viral defense system